MECRKHINKWNSWKEDFNYSTPRSHTFIDVTTLRSMLTSTWEKLFWRMRRF